MKTAITLSAIFLLAACAIAQDTGAKAKHPAAKTTKSAKAEVPDRAFMQRIWDAWTTMDPAKAAPFYSKDPENVYYDLTPLKYQGWAEYEKGVANLLKEFKSLKFVVGNDARVWSRDDGALGTATLHAEIVNADGSPATMELRWTVVWHRESGHWLIVHEHVSAPLGGGPAGPAHPPAPKRQ